MRDITRFVGFIGLTAIATAVAAGALPDPAVAGPAAAAPATLTASAGGPAAAPAAGLAAPAPVAGRPIAYVRAGKIYVARGTVERRLTNDTDDARPRWSPDGGRIAYRHADRVWVINSDGTGARQVTTVPSGAPAWSPDGTHLAFAAPGCTGLPGVFQVPAGGGAPEALFPAECRATPPGRVAPAETAGADLASRLRADDAVAYSPDGASIAFRGGGCEAIFDDCLSVGTVATGAEHPVIGYGGGGQVYSGFAVVPAYTPDGRGLSYTTEVTGDSGQTSQPLHVARIDLAGGTPVAVGVPGDRELVYVDARVGLLTGQYRSVPWVIQIDLASGARTPLHPGSQPAAGPTGA